MRNVDRSPLFTALFPGQPGRVMVSAGQFAAGDFPPVCAMTGLPADTRRRFRFFRAPGWSFVFGLLMLVGLGFLISGLLIFLVAQKVSGYLPLTTGSVKRLELVMRVSIVIAAMGGALLIAALILFAMVSPSAHLVALQFLAFGLLLLVFGFTGVQIGLQTLKPLYGPTAIVLPKQAEHPDTWIELRNVHPAFVAAVEQQRTAGVASVS